MIEIVPYRPEWPEDFEKIAVELDKTLGNLALQINHIGSTAVPGLAAKDVIDVQVTVVALTDELREKFLKAGYAPTRHTTDHVPPGQPTDPAEWQKLLFRERPGDRRANIHVRVDGRANHRYALLMRDYLRAFPAAAEGYGRAKMGIVKYHPEEDMEAYYDIKDPIFDIIFVGAEYWEKEKGERQKEKESP